jgi:hypothetical protein
MYLFGPLRKPGEGEEEGKMIEDAKTVQDMLDKLMARNDKRPDEPEVKSPVDEKV